MRITPDLFEAFLKCPTKCWLRATAEAASGNIYAEWVDDRNEAYRVAETERLLTQTPPAESALSPPAGNLAKYGEIVAQSPGSLQLKVKRDRVIQVCKALLDELPVSDIDLQEVPIEEVIRRIFAR